MFYYPREWRLKCILGKLPSSYSNKAALHSLVRRLLHAARKRKRARKETRSIIASVTRTRHVDSIANVFVIQTSKTDKKTQSVVAIYEFNGRIRQEVCASPTAWKQFSVTTPLWIELALNSEVTAIVVCDRTESNQKYFANDFISVKIPTI